MKLSTPSQIAIALMALLLLVTGGWYWTESSYIPIHKHGVQNLPVPRQMNAQFEEVDNFIVHYGSGKQPMEWQTVAFIEGRFTLTTVVPVKVDYLRRTVKAAGQPTFYLEAVESIHAPPGGLVSAAFSGDLQRQFGSAKWDKFVAAGFDLSSLGIPKKEIRPVPFWRDYVHAFRKDRVPIK